MDYVPPAGARSPGRVAARATTPKRVVREDLRNFKRIMEIGEVPTHHRTSPTAPAPAKANRTRKIEWRPLFT